MSTKVVKSIREAIGLSGLKDGMTVSFHHHLRNGDYVLNMVMEEIARLGVKDLTVNASSLFDTHAPLADHIRNGVVTAIQTDYMAAGLGKEISRGLMAKPVQFRTHGGRPSAIADGTTPIDVAFIAAPSADPMGNCSGKYGKSACGSLGYAAADAMYAKKVVVITDGLEMRAMTDHYGSGEIAVAAIQAGVDLLLCPQNLDEAVSALERAVDVAERLIVLCRRLIKESERPRREGT